MSYAFWKRSQPEASCRADHSLCRRLASFRSGEPQGRQHRQQLHGDPHRAGEGRRDRYVMLSLQLLGILRSYWRMARPTLWLFPRRDPEHPTYPVVLHAACRSAFAASGLCKRLTGHPLRHSFAVTTASREPTTAIVLPA